MKLFLIIVMFVFSCCQTKNHKNEKNVSRSKKYYLITSINSASEVLINVFDSSGNLKSVLDKNASDLSKWAVGWDNKNDTIILFSSDIGTHAWKIEQDSFMLIDITNDIKQKAQEIKAKKYSNER